jgi:hypothetical protein
MHHDEPADDEEYINAGAAEIRPREDGAIVVPGMVHNYHQGCYASMDSMCVVRAYRPSSKMLTLLRCTSIWAASYFPLTVWRFQPESLNDIVPRKRFGSWQKWVSAPPKQPEKCEKTCRIPLIVDGNRKASVLMFIQPNRNQSQI